MHPSRMSQGVEISSEMTLVIDLERYVEARRPSHQHPTSDSTLYQPVGGTITVADYLEVAGKQRAGDLLWDADPRRRFIGSLHVASAFTLGVPGSKPAGTQPPICRKIHPASRTSPLTNTARQTGFRVAIVRAVSHVARYRLAIGLRQQ